METIQSQQLNFRHLKSCDFWKWKKECKDHKRIGEEPQIAKSIRVKNRS